METNKFELKVNGDTFNKGDELSIGVIFKNLTGSNFDRAEDPLEEHKQWIAYMAKTNAVDLPALSDVRMLTPQGILLHQGNIAAGVPRTDPKGGEDYMVKVYPMGATPVWVKTRMLCWQDASAVSREKFFFSAPNGCYVVTRDELLDRVVALSICQQYGSLSESKAG